MSVLAASNGALAEALAQIASALRTPVLVLALLALLVCALEAGRFCMEAFTRMRSRRSSLQSLAGQVLAHPGQAELIAQGAPNSFAAAALLVAGRAQLAGEPVGVEHALADFELAVERRLNRTRILVRAGPALGLMGTLIPLAPGLAALGRGDVSTLAGDLRTAFAATTIGLLVGTVAFALTLTRTRFYSEDLTALERGFGAASVRVASGQAPPPLPPPTQARAPAQGDAPARLVEGR